MLKAPHWAEKMGAIPTIRGWVSPTTGELLISRKHSERQVIEWREANGVPVVDAPAAPTEAAKLEEELALAQALAEPVPAPAPVPAAEPVAEGNEVLQELVNSTDFDAMTKAEIDAWSNANLELDLDGRKSKSVMIETIKAHVNGG